MRSVRALYRHALARLHRATLAGPDRGDVPGWVLVAVMTAGLVTALWLVADDQLTSVLNRAITSVTRP
jgi:hypothetical protein